ncbi:RNA-binding protein [archaeon]|nr:RNA-binding protein [archaeon]
MKRTRLKAKDFNKELEQAAYSVKFSKKDSIERIEDKDNNLKIISVNKVPAFFYYEERLIPTIKFLHTKPEFLKTVTVDMGAIKFVVSGADIMRPGIMEYNQLITEGEIIAIIDERNKMVICVGISLLDASVIKEQEKGKSVKNIHYVGDEIWKFS